MNGKQVMFEFLMKNLSGHKMSFRKYFGKLVIQLLKV